MEDRVKVVLLGVGCMGEAILRGMDKLGLNWEVIGVERTIEQMIVLAKQYPGIEFLQTADAIVGDADVVVLCVKPQQFSAAAKTIKGKLSPECLVISIMAGVTIAKLREALNHSTVVRAMPNMPGQIGRGYTGWFATETNAKQVQRASAVLGSLGTEHRFDQEYLLDVVTAVSGSGPGVWAYLIQAYIEYAVKDGMGRLDAREAVLQTVRGTTEYLLESGEHPVMLQEKVTSSGGTTAAAIYELDKGGVRAAIVNSGGAAKKRSRQLSR